MKHADEKMMMILTDSSLKKYVFILFQIMNVCDNFVNL